MPIPFFSIPEHIQVSICEKLNFENFVTFHGCSRVGYQIAKKVKSLFSKHLKDISLSPTGALIFQINGFPRNIIADRLYDLPIHLKVDLIVATNSLIKLIKSFEHLIITAEELVVCKGSLFSDCSSQQFNNLLESLKVNKIMLHCRIPPEYYSVSAIEKIQNVTVNDFSFSDRELLLVKGKHIHILRANITNTGINQLIKEWIRGERGFKELYVHNFHLMNEELIFAGLPMIHQNIRHSNGRSILYRVFCNGIHLHHIRRSL